MENRRQNNHTGRSRARAELLAPAGSFESMKAAVAAGADAVYIGGSRFGARAYADNLDEERMLEAIDYAHLHGVSLYMTVNTLLKEKELEGLYGYLAPYYERGLDAVIVQDLGVLTAVRRWFPDLHIHASTQVTVTGAGGARLLKELGAVRVVTARELSLAELRDIHENVDIEIESFVHGALCYCYSGQCLLSSLIGGRSGNRGRCAQPCRLPYDVTVGTGGAERYLNGRNERYVMSMKDLCTLDILPDILESGVYSLKIEGRMKSPEYTAGVVSIYRKYVDLCLREGRGGYRVDDADRKLLLELFDRGGQTEGYYRKHNGKDMLVLKEKPEFRQTDRELFDRLDRTYVNASVTEKIRGRLKAAVGEPLKLSLWPEGAEGEAVTVFGAVVQPSKNQPVTAQRIDCQIRKTGGTPFEFESLEIRADGDLFVPVQALNELRREGLERLQEAILRPYRRSLQAAPEARRPSGMRTGESLKPRLHALVSDAGQFAAAAAEADIAEVQIEADALPPGEWQSAVRRCHAAGKECILAMPVICRTEAADFFERCGSKLYGAGFDGFLIRSLEEPRLLEGLYAENGGGKLPPMYADHNLYVFNRLAAETLTGMGFQRLTYPLELNAREMRDLAEKCMRKMQDPAEKSARETQDPAEKLPGLELTAYGYLPVMTTAQCVRRTVSGCDRKPGFLALKDRMGKILPVYNHCVFCYNTIYNPTPLSLLGLEEPVRKLWTPALRLQFLNETPQELSDIVRAFGDAFLRQDAEKEKRRAPENDREGKNGFSAGRSGGYTRGHMKRGVE